MENRSFLDLSENKILKIILLFVLLIVALLYSYFNNSFFNNPELIYIEKPTIRGAVIAIPYSFFFPAGLLNLIPLFQGRPEAPEAGVAALLIGPFVWIIYVFLGGLYVSFRRPISYSFLVIFLLLLLLNIAGCNGM